MPDTTDGALAAVDAGIAEASSPVPEPTPAPAPDAAPPPAAAAAPAPVSVAATQADGAPPDVPPTQDAAADAGEGAETPEKPEGEEPPKAEGETPPADAAPPRDPDPINDPIPNALKRETKERIKGLIGMVQERTDELSLVRAERDEILGYVRETKATPEQYGQALQYLKMVNSGDPVQIKQALVFIQGEIQALARMAGEPVPGIDFLQGHDDLISEVNAGRITAQRAQEIAAARERSSWEQRNSQAREQAAAEQREAAAARQRGVQELNALEAELKRDPAFAAKRAVLIPALKPVFARLPPDQWAPAFRKAYRDLPAPAAAPAPRAPTPSAAAITPPNTPLRAGATPGTPAPAPKSPLDALNQALESFGR